LRSFPDLSKKIREIVTEKFTTPKSERKFRTEHVQRISDSLNQVGGDETIFQQSSVFFHVFSDPKGQRMGHGIRLFLLKNKFHYELRKDAAVAIVSGKKTANGMSLAPNKLS